MGTTMPVVPMSVRCRFAVTGCLAKNGSVLEYFLEADFLKFAAQILGYEGKFLRLPGSRLDAMPFTIGLESSRPFAIVLESARQIAKALDSIERLSLAQFLTIPYEV